jgi:hypothetical protein
MYALGMTGIPALTADKYASAMFRPCAASIAL